MRALSFAMGALFTAASLVGACGSNQSGGSGFDGGPGGDGGPTDGMIFGGDRNLGGDSMKPPGGDPQTCADAAQSHSYIGCDYWPTPSGNAVWNIFDFAVVVANTLSTPASVTVTGPNGTNQTATVPSGQLVKIYLPWVSTLKGPDADECGDAMTFVSSVLQTNGAYHLVSSVPVTVYQFNALEYKGQGGPQGKDWSACPGNGPCTNPASPAFGATLGCFSFSNDASLLLPSTAMTPNYRVMTIHSIQGLGGYFTVTGTQPNTNVTVTMSSTSQVGAGTGIQGAGPGGTVSFVLNAGDVAEVVATGDPNTTADLSGSLVKASAPVQVMGGITCISIPNGPMDSCDHVEESVFPAETLGKHYVVTVPTGPNGAPVGHLVRIYGNADGTSLTYAPSTPPGCPSTINAGQVVECGVVSADFEITGNHEFGVGSFMESAAVVDPNNIPPNQKGDPSMSLATAVEQYRTKYIFLAPSDYDVNYADVVAPPGTALTLDGAPVAAAATPISGGYGVVRVPLSVGSANGAHILTATNPVGIQVLGYGAYTSYQYPGGLDLAQIAPPPPK